MLGSAKGLGSLSLVIPAYNEEERLPALLEQLQRTAQADVSRAGLELLEVLVVDDASTDRTAEMLRAAAAADPKLVAVIDAAGGKGKGAAVAAGVRRAGGDYVLLADVDLSTPLGELEKLSAALDGPGSIAIGSRALDDSVVDRGPTHRKVLGGGFNRVVRLLTALDVRDTQCGFKLIEAELARELLADQTCPGFSFDVELLLRAHLAGARIAEVPVPYVHDCRSRVRVLSASVRMLRDVLGLAYRTRPRRSWSEQAMTGPGELTSTIQGCGMLSVGIKSAVADPSGSGIGVIREASAKRRGRSSAPAVEARKTIPWEGSSIEAGASLLGLKVSHSPAPRGGEDTDLGETARAL